MNKSLLFSVTLFLTCALAAAIAEPVLFNIPAQNAAAALLEFSRQADVNVLYSYRDLQRVQSNEVIGRFEPETALDTLLKGTGFRGVKEGPRRFVISPVPRKDSLGIVTGVVFKAGSQTPVPEALVRVSGTSLQTRSDYRGRFSLRSVPTGHVILGIVADNFRPLRIDDVAVTAHRVTDLGEVSLPAASQDDSLDELIVLSEQIEGVSANGAWALQDFNVTPSRFGLDDEPAGAIAMLSQEDLLALPQFGEDLYRSIAHLPGLSADDYTARFWIRGSPHDQVLSRLDGVDLIEPFHMKDTDGSLSIVDIESIGRLNLHTGGFGAEFGDKTAGILEMETLADFSYPRRTSVSLSYTGARVAHLGQTADRRLRWSGAFRKGFPKMALEENQEDGDAKIEPTYHDLSAKVVYDLNARNTLSFHVLHAFDEMNLATEGDPTLKSRYENNYGWLRWIFQPNEQVRSETVVAYTQTLAARDGVGKLDSVWDSAVADDRELHQISLRHETKWAFSDRLILRGGANFAQGKADYDYRSARLVGDYANGTIVRRHESRSAKFDLEGNRIGAFASARYRLTDSLLLESGLRFDQVEEPGSSRVSPRLAIAWTKGFTVRAAWGNYHQSHGLHELSVADGEVSPQPMERVEHRVLSIEKRVRTGLNLRLEAYQKVSHSPRIHWENVYGTLDTFPEIEGDRIRFAPTAATAKGIEAIVEHRLSSKLRWSGSYALAETKETLPDGRTLPRRRDQRHTLYVDLTYNPTPKWQFSATFQFHTGWPVTEQVFTRRELNSGQIVWTSEPGPLYGLRLPDYYRLDLRAQRRFRFKASELRVYLDLFNATNRENLVSYDYRVIPVNGEQRVERVPGDKLLPLLPSLGLEWSF